MLGYYFLFYHDVANMQLWALHGTNSYYIIDKFSLSTLRVLV